MIDGQFKAYDRLVDRIGEIVDFTPYFPNTAIIVPHNQFCRPVSLLLREAYAAAGLEMKFANVNSIGGWDFLTNVYAVSSNAMRGRTVDTIYLPQRDDLHPRQVDDYDYMYSYVAPVMSSMKYSRIYVY